MNLEDLIKARAQAQAETAKWQKRVAALDIEIKEAKCNVTKLNITQHAKMRYIERLLGLDTEVLFENLSINEKLLSYYNTLGPGKYILDDVTFVLGDDAKVVTVIY